MSTERWRTARIAEIPPLGLSAEPGYWKEWTEDEGYAARWHSVREHFGIQAFGVNACHGDAGQEIVQGRVRFTCDGKEVELGEGEMLFLEPDVQRAGIALETPTLVLMIGGVAGKPFEPDWEPLET
jgi:AraC-like ligand binding domain